MKEQRRELIYNNEVALETKYDNYFVTKGGIPLSIKKIGGQGSTDINNPREMKTSVDKDGYKDLSISYMENGKQKRVYPRLHRLVYETYNGSIPDDLTVDHIDGNINNNSLSNLQLLTREDNTRKAIAGKPSPHRAIYNIFLNGELLYTLDRKQIYEKFGFKLELLKDMHKPQLEIMKNYENQGYKFIRIN